MSPSTKGRGGRALAIGAGALLLAATAAGTTAASLYATPAATRQWDIPLASVPAGDFLAQCPQAPRPVEGAAAAGTDPAYGADGESARTAVRATVLSDVAERVPGASVSTLEGTRLEHLSPRLSAAEAEQVASANQEGLSGLAAKTAWGIEEGSETVLSVQPLGGLQSLGDMVRTYAADDGDLAGLAASSCQSPSNDQWLVGASTTVGSTALLLLANPSETAATANLELYGAQGRIEAGNTRGIVLAPGATRSIVLAGLAAEEPALSVRVQSSGGRITAVIQQSALHGLVPGGVDFIEPSAAMSTTQVVPGVLLQDPDDTAAVGSQDGYAGTAPELFVAVAGNRPAELKVRAYGVSGEVALPDGGAVKASGEGTTGIPLGSLPRGTYTFVVEADRPVAAGARLLRGAGKGKAVDMAWAPSAERLGSRHLVAVPELATSTLVFGSAGAEATVELRPVSADGTIGRATTLPLEGGGIALAKAAELGKGTVAVVVSSSGGGAYGAQLLQRGKAGVSVLTVPPGTEGQRGVAVDIRY